MFGTQESLDRRQKILLTIAWASTMAPLAAFFFFSWQTYGLRKEVASSRQEVANSRAELMKTESAVDVLEARKQELEREIAVKQEDLARYRDLAGIRLRFYRESDRSLVQGVAKELQLTSELGTSPLIDSKPSALAYGSEVSEADQVAIAIAFVKAGFPLRTIGRAQRVSDAKLIQVIASKPAEQRCGLLTVAAIQAGKTCGEQRP